jgi:ABC-type dipeptide/oligopeptide/nickel transport system permease subunit
MPNSTPAVDPTWLVAGTIIGLAVGLSAGYALGKLSGLSMFVNRVVTKEMAR